MKRYEKFCLTVIAVATIFLAQFQVDKIEKEAQVRVFTSRFNNLSKVEKVIFFTYLGDNMGARHNVKVDAWSSNPLGAYYNNGKIVVSVNEVSDFYKGKEAIKMKVLSNRLFKQMMSKTHYELGIDEASLPMLIFLHEYGHSITMTAGNSLDYGMQRYALERFGALIDRKGANKQIVYDFYRNVLTWEYMADEFAVEMMFKHALTFTKLLDGNCTQKEMQKLRSDTIKIGNRIRMDKYFSKGV